MSDHTPNTVASISRRCISTLTRCPPGGRSGSPTTRRGSSSWRRGPVRRTGWCTSPRGRGTGRSKAGPSCRWGTPCARGASRRRWARRRRRTRCAPGWARHGTAARGASTPTRRDLDELQNALVRDRTAGYADASQLKQRMAHIERQIKALDAETGKLRRHGGRSGPAPDTALASRRPDCFWAASTARRRPWRVWRRSRASPALGRGAASSAAGGRGRGGCCTWPR